jgi:hypothetical protein
LFDENGIFCIQSGREERWPPKFVRHGQVYTRVHSMHVLWKIFGVSFELLAHNHVEVGAQVFSFGGWRSIKSLSETLSINNRLVI